MKLAVKGLPCSEMPRESSVEYFRSEKMRQRFLSTRVMEDSVLQRNLHLFISNQNYQVTAQDVENLEISQA